MSSPPHASGPTGGAPPIKRRLRNYLLNPRFQLKYTGLIVGVAVTLMTGLGVLVARTAGIAADLAESAAVQAERAMNESLTNSHLVRMNDLVNAVDNPELVQTISDELRALDVQAARNVERVRAERSRVGRYRRITAWSLVGAGALLALALAAVGIVVTHKVVGPVFKLKRLLRKVGAGKLDIQERLRKGDELNDLFEVFMEMVAALKRHQIREIDRLEAGINHAVSEGAPYASLERLRELKKDMEVALEPPDASALMPVPALGPR